MAAISTIALIATAVAATASAGVGVVQARQQAKDAQKAGARQASAQDASIADAASQRRREQADTIRANKPKAKRGMLDGVLGKDKKNATKLTSGAPAGLNILLGD